MGLKDIFKKVTKRVEESVGGEESLEEEFPEEGLGAEEQATPGEEEEQFSETEFGKEPEFKPTKGEKEKTPIFEEEEAPEKLESLEEESFETPKTAQAGDLKAQLDALKSKLDLVETHLQNIENKEEMHKLEADRYIQYLTFMNEKLDHLERELSEIERLIKR